MEQRRSQGDPGSPKFLACLLILCFERRYTKGHQPFWNCELFLVYRLMRRYTSLIHASETKILLNLPSIILVLILVNVKTLIMLMSFLKQTRGRPRWSLRATCRPRAPRWWPLRYTMQNTVARLKSNMFAPQNFWPPKFWAGYATVMAEHLNLAPSWL